LGGPPWTLAEFSSFGEQHGAPTWKERSGHFPVFPEKKECTITCARGRREKKDAITSVCLGGRREKRALKPTNV